MKEKKGILLVSFGTSYPETREKTIETLARKITLSFPEYPVFQAWTSKVLRKKLLRTTGEHIFSVREAMEVMISEGFTHIYVQPTHILNGIEYQLMQDEALVFQTHLSSLRFGAPLLSSQEDMEKFVEGIHAHFLSSAPEEGWILMGHGTHHHSNTVYAALNYLLQDKGLHHVHIGTIEAYPTISDLLPRIKKQDQKIWNLVPMLIVAGDHASNDMASDEEDSWKSILQNEGYETRCHLVGLGELPFIQSIFLEHLKQILNAKS